jgi:hypothetical protein
VNRLIALFLLCILPLCGWAQETNPSISGIDDTVSPLPLSDQAALDGLISYYYADPSTERVNQILDVMNKPETLRKKSAWASFVGFLTVVFKDNPKALMGWMSREDYNTYAEDVFVAALLHAGHKDEALTFAQAHGWSKPQLEKLAASQDRLDLKHLVITVPGHIDTLWGAFFASGDEVYIREIIGVLFMTQLPDSPLTYESDEHDVLGENKKLAKSTLARYAPFHPFVRRAIEERLGTTREPLLRDMLKSLLPPRNSVSPSH